MLFAVAGELHVGNGADRGIQDRLNGAVGSRCGVVETLGDRGLILLGGRFGVFDGVGKDAGGVVVPQLEFLQVIENDLKCASRRAFRDRVWSSWVRWRDERGVGLDGDGLFFPVRMAVHPVIAVLSRSRLMVWSRRASQSNPIIPTPASGWIVTSHPVHRCPSSSRIPGWADQHGGTTVAGTRYVRRNQPTHSDSSRRVWVYPTGSRASQLMVVGTGGASVVTPKSAGSNAGWFTTTARGSRRLDVCGVQCRVQSLGFPPVQGFPLGRDRVGQPGQVVPDLSPSSWYTCSRFGAGRPVAGGDHPQRLGLDLDQRASGSAFGGEEPVLPRSFPVPGAFHADGDTGETGFQQHGVMPPWVW